MVEPDTGLVFFRNRWLNLAILTSIPGFSVDNQFKLIIF